MYEKEILCFCMSVSSYHQKLLESAARHTISTKKQKLASPPIMISPPQRRVRWSFLNQDGKRGGGKWQGGKEKRK